MWMELRWMWEEVEEAREMGRGGTNGGENRQRG